MKRARSAKPRRAEPTPTVEELLGINITRRDAFECGHLAALSDELHEITKAARRLNPIRSDKTRDPDYKVSIPFWVLEAVERLAWEDVSRGRSGHGKNAHKWSEQYEEDLVRWHRYAHVKRAIAERRAVWTEGSPRCVFEVVSEELKGTRFDCLPRAIKDSYEEVSKALKRGHAGRFYRSTTWGQYKVLTDDMRVGDSLPLK